MDEVKPAGSQVLQDALRVVAGPTRRDYAHPAVEFARLGALWGALLGIPAIPPERIALMMVLQKVNRQFDRAKHDNLVDIAGYAATVEMILGEALPD